MTPRIYHALSITLVLLILTACGSNMPRQGDGAPSEPAYNRGDSSGPGQLPLSTQQESADRSLAEITALSAKMSTYQPDLALDILGSLESIPSGKLRALTEQQNLATELKDWLELALQIRSAAMSGSASTAAAIKWAGSHPGHLVTRSKFSELVASYSAAFPVPSQVAILLPAEGRLSAAAKAIRDGIMSAYLEQPGDSVIRFYPSGPGRESAITAYWQASDDGAMQIIGPLDIGSTRAIADLDGLTTPVLLLNDMTPGMEGKTAQAGMVNSLSLSTTEEAVAIATKALEQGQRKAIMMVPDSGWGRRIEAAFSTAFELGGGQIVASTRFNTTESDHSAMLTALLKIDASKQRKAALQSWLGIPLAFEPSRRYDFEFIFLAASPIEGRELKPLLRFHDAGDVPVYAMGRIFSGRVNRASDRDLDGIVFPATRWQLRGARNTDYTPASVRGGASGNLYALGMDAWRLLPWLPLLRRDPDLWFPGEVGALQLQADGRLYREPAWAQFSAGMPVAFQWPQIDDESINQ